MTDGVLPSDAAALDARRILVIAPHPDDEALGCGGLIAVLAGHGRLFHVVFVTDGGASHLGSRRWSRERLAGQRRGEAEEALRVLGLGRHGRSFLWLADAAMPSLLSAEGQAAVSAVEAIVREFAPDLVLLPWRRDPHCDHRDAWSLVHAALAAAGSRPETLEYAVWLDEIGTPEDHPVAEEAEWAAFDVSEVMDVKRAAVSAHVSQTTGLIDDDPGAFRLTPDTIARLTGPVEIYWRPLR